MKSSEERFWEKVEKGNPDECWNWKAFKNPAGYGQCWDGEKLMLSHRYSWLIHNGEIPERLCVLHRCDNPSCCNPGHLWLGTQPDNIQDMIKKNRDRKAIGNRHGSKTHPESILHGEQKPASKLVASDVIRIREMISAGVPQRIIASLFGVSKPQISYIKNGQTWSHLQ